MKKPMKWYKPMQIANLGLITNRKNSTDTMKNYYFILGLIKRSELKAKNYSQGNKPYFMVSEKEIEKYHNRLGK